MQLQRVCDAKDSDGNRFEICFADTGSIGAARVRRFDGTILCCFSSGRMSILTYHAGVRERSARTDKLLVWLAGEIKSPPFSVSARIECGLLLRRLQRGESLSMPSSRPMPTIGSGCHELRVIDANKSWRIIYRIYPDAIVIGEVFAKTTQATPRDVIQRCRRRFAQFDRDLGDES